MRRRALLRRFHKSSHFVAKRRKLARWIGDGSVAGQQGRLAAAAPKVELAKLATPARLRHPRSTAKAVESFRLVPDPSERPRPHVIEPQSLDLAGSWTGKHVADGIYCQIPAAPPVHARFRPAA